MPLSSDRRRHIYVAYDYIRVRVGYVDGIAKEAGPLRTPFNVLPYVGLIENASGCRSAEGYPAQVKIISLAQGRIQRQYISRYSVAFISMI